LQTQKHPHVERVVDDDHANAFRTLRRSH
jgi:hypothetical protein